MLALDLGPSQLAPPSPSSPGRHGLAPLRTPSSLGGLAPAGTERTGRAHPRAAADGAVVAHKLLAQAMTDPAGPAIAGITPVGLSSRNGQQSQYGQDPGFLHRNHLHEIRTTLLQVHAWFYYATSCFDAMPRQPQPAHQAACPQRSGGPHGA